jgi:hypothetical protein
MHEVSLDGQNWEPAKERPELFASPVVRTATPTNRADSNGGHTSKATSEEYGGDQKGHEARATPAASKSEAWYYVYGGTEQGPVDFATLSDMMANRQLPADTEVWRNGMAEWVPANTVPGLVANTVSSASVGHSSEKSYEVNAGVVRVLVESRGWIIFISVFAFIYAALQLAGGLLMIIVGPRLAADTALGLMQMISSVVIGFGGWLLMSYAGGVERFHRRLDEDSLSMALATLKTLWTYIGIVLIVSLAAAAIIIVMALSMAGSFSELFRRFS